MTLKEYVFSLSELDRQVFADKVGLKFHYLRHLYLGYRVPNGKVARRIFDASGHKIDLESLSPDVFKDLVFMPKSNLHTQNQQNDTQL